MSLRSKLDITLVSLAVVLGGYLFITRDAPTQTEVEARKNNLLPAFRPEDITKIVVESENRKQQLILRRAQGDELGRAFLLGATGSRKAEESAVDAFISTLDFSTFQRTLENVPEDRHAELGFNAPRLVVTIEAGPRSYRVVLGKPATNPQGAVYARVSGSNVPTILGVVEEGVARDLDLRTQQFDSQLVFPYSRRETSLLIIESTAGTSHLKADELGFLLEPLKGAGPPRRADRTLTDLIFFQLARAKFESYLPNVPTKTELQTWDRRVTITQESPHGPTYRATLGGECEGELLTRAYRESPVVSSGCVTQTALAAFRLEPERLLDRSAAPLHPEEIDHVRITWREQRLDLMRKDAEYRLLSDDSRPVAKESGDEFLRTLADAQLEPVAEGDADPAKWQDAPGRITIIGQSPITAVGEAKDPSSLDAVRELTLDVQEGERPDERLVRRRDDQAVFRIPVSHLWAFSADDAWTRALELTQFAPSEVASVEVKPQSGSPFRLVRQGEVFVFEDQARGAVDAALARVLVEELASLKAVRFEVPPQARPTQSALEVSFEVERKGKRHKETLWLGARTRGGYRAWATLTRGSFVVSDFTRLTLETPVEDRDPVRLVPEDLETLSLKQEDRLYEFARVAGLLRPSGGDAVDEMVAPLTDALRAIEVVSIRPKHAPSEVPGRGRVTTALTGTRKWNGTIAPFELNLGPAGVYQGQSVRAVWLEGSSEVFLVRAATLSPLEELL